MKKQIAATLISALLLGSVASAEVLSPWAVPEFESANSAGLLPESIVSDRLTDFITREEFCEIVMNFYKVMGGEIPSRLSSPFTDTKNNSVKLAYTLDVINGKTETLFCPDDLITRQEMAKIVMRTVNVLDKEAHITLEELEKLLRFEDFDQTDDWAATDIAKSIKYEVINGVSETHLAPKGYATREQAIAIVNRAFNVFSSEKNTYSRPKITNLLNGSTVSGNLSVSWTGTKDAKSYTVIVKDITGATALIKNTKNTHITLTNLTYNRDYTIIIGAKIDDNITVYSDKIDIFYGKDEHPGVLPTLLERYNRVFPGGVPFETKSEADANMQTVEIPVWRMDESGRKYSSAASIVVNRSLSDEVVKIFTEIYKSSEQFPIKDVGAYSWRTTAFGSVSQHSYGTCIDINFNENYYAYPSGEAITGSFWRPYENPFSITPDGSVVKAFSKYGWTWGGSWTSVKDYMHFSYLGK